MISKIDYYSMLNVEQDNTPGGEREVAMSKALVEIVPDAYAQIRFEMNLYSFPLYTQQITVRSENGDV